VLALFFVVGALMLGGAVWSYVDEHSGRAARAHVTNCYSPGTARYRGVYCSGTWTVDGRTVSGDIFNGVMGDEGKTLSVRVHGGRATKPTLWVSIGLAVFGAMIIGFGIWLAGRVRRQGSASSGASPA
jgi:hypothetical protein